MFTRKRLRSLLLIWNSLLRFLLPLAELFSFALKWFWPVLRAKSLPRLVTLMRFRKLLLVFIDIKIDPLGSYYITYSWAFVKPPVRPFL